MIDLLVVLIAIVGAMLSPVVTQPWLPLGLYAIAAAVLIRGLVSADR